MTIGPVHQQGDTNSRKRKREETRTRDAVQPIRAGVFIRSPKFPFAIPRPDKKPEIGFRFTTVGGRNRHLAFFREVDRAETITATVHIAARYLVGCVFVVV